MTGSIRYGTLASVLKVLYDFIVSFAALITVPYWYIKDGGRRGGWASRYGWIPRQIREEVDPFGCVWFHAASVGEVRVLAALIPAYLSMGCFSYNSSKADISLQFDPGVNQGLNGGNR